MEGNIASVSIIGRIIFACSFGNAEMMRLLLSFNAHVNITETKRRESGRIDDGECYLHQACYAAITSSGFLDVEEALPVTWHDAAVKWRLSGRM